jgi:hypothetical protein
MIPIVATKNRHLTGFFSFAKLIENAMIPFLYPDPLKFDQSEGAIAPNPDPTVSSSGLSRRDRNPYSCRKETSFFCPKLPGLDKIK